MYRTINGRMSRHGNFLGSPSRPYGPEAPPARATKDAAEVAATVAADPTASTDVRTAARAIIASYELGTQLLQEHVELCVNHISKGRAQNRYGQ